MKKKLLTSLALIVSAALVAGCSMLEMTSRNVRNDLVGAAPYTVINSVQAWRGKLISVAGIAGDEEVRIDRTIEVASAALEHRGHVRFLLPTDQPAGRLDELEVHLEEGKEVFATALAKTLRAYLGFAEKEIEIDVVLASELGSFYTSSVPVKERLLTSILIYNPFSTGTFEVEGSEDWWSATILVTAHEHAHLHYSLVEDRPRAINEETAASLLGSCAHYRYGLMTGLLEGPVSFFGDSEDFQRRDRFPEDISQLFPELHLGRLAPDLHALEKLEGGKGSSRRGRALADAVLYLLADGKSLDPTQDQETFKRIFDYCDGLAIEVPRFHAGEWQASP